MSLRVRCELRTTLEETVNRVYDWAQRHDFMSQWDARRSIALVWERDDGWDRDGDRFYWKRFVVRVTRTDGGSRIDARARCRKWIPVATPAWLILALVSVLAFGAYDLLDWRGHVNWRFAATMSIVWLGANAFPFFTWRSQQRVARDELGDLAAGLADALAEPPDPAPATVGPYR